MRRIWFSNVKIKNFSIILSLIIGMGVNVNAATRTSKVLAGNWSNASSWVEGVVPVAGDAVTIVAGAIIHVDGNYSCSSLVVNTNAASGSCFLYMVAGESLNVSGNVTINRPAATYNSDLSVDAGTLTVGGNIDLKGVATGTSRITTLSVSTGTISVTGDILSAGTDSKVTFTDAGTLNIGGAFMTTPGTFTCSTGTINYNGIAQTITSYNYYNLSLSGSGSYTYSAISAISNNFTISNSVSLTTGTSLAVSGNVELSGTASVINSGGAMQIAGGLIIGSGTTFKANISGFAVSGATTVNGTLQIGAGATKTFSSLITINSGGVLEMVGSSPSPTTATYSYQSGSTLLYSGSAAKTAGSECPSTIPNGATLKVSNTGGITLGTVTIGGGTSGILEILNDGVVTTVTSLSYAAGSTLLYSGTVAKSSANAEWSASTRNVTVNNSAGVTLGAAKTMSGILTLTSGKLTTTGANLLSLTRTSTDAISGGSTSSYISGPVLWTLPSSLASGSTYSLPIGSATVYLPLQLINPTTGVGAVTVTAQAFSASAGGTMDATLIAQSTSEYWSLASSGNFTNSTVSLTRQTAVTNNVVGRSTTKTGVYSSLCGTVSGNKISSSTTSTGAAQFFIMATDNHVISASSSTANATYGSGSVIDVTLDFHSTVTVTGTPRILLEMGSTDQYATYSSGSGSTTLHFSYTTQYGDNTSDLDYASTSALELNGGTITSATCSNTPSLTLAAPGAANSLGSNKAIVINALSTLYSEDFSNAALDNKGQNAASYDVAGVSNWSINGPISGIAAGKYFKQIGGVFKGLTGSGYSGIWYSTITDISCFTDVSVGADFIVPGTTYSSSGMEASYIIDGGAPVMFYKVDNSTVTYPNPSVGLSGASTIQIQVYIYSGNSSSNYSFDNVYIQGKSVEPTSHPVSFTATANGTTCTQVDLTFSAANTITTCADGYLILQREGAAPTGMPSDLTKYSVNDAIGDASVAAIITNAAATSASVTVSSGETQYYYSIFPYNMSGSVASTYNYKTTGFLTANATTISCAGLSVQPSSHPAAFAVNYSSTCGQLDLNFSAASTITNAYGYLILRRSGAAPTGTPTDAASYAIGSTIGDATVVANISSTSTTSYIDAGLTNATAYYYTIFPYNYDGSHAYSYNYKISGYKSGNDTTIFCNVVIGNATGNEAGTYQSSYIAVNGNESNWWDVNIYDKSDLHNGTASGVHNVISSIAVDLNLDATRWTTAEKGTSNTFTNNHIYMANYSNVSDLPSAYTTENDVTTGTGVTWTEVYSGSITFNGLGWNKITLTTPFYYNGSGSLLLKFTRSSGNVDAAEYPDFGYINAGAGIRQVNSSYATAGPSPNTYMYLKLGINYNTINGDLSLPVEFLSFESKCLTNRVELIWKTASEENNDYFAVEKSLDGVEFYQLGIVRGSGNSNTVKSYTFFDNEVSDANAYYRLKQVDFDGKFSYSTLTTTNCSSDRDGGIVVYPIPSQDNLNVDVECKECDKLNILIYNQVGQVVYENKSVAVEGLNKITLRNIKLANGAYLLKLTKNGEKEYYQKVMMQ